MTPLQLAKAECDNCHSAGNCSGIGIRIEPNGKIKLYRFRDEGRCWLVPDAEGNITRCPHFEECIAPLVQSRVRAAVTQEEKHAAAKLAEGVRDYELGLHIKPVSAKFRCASDGCRRTVLRPARYCVKHGQSGS